DPDDIVFISSVDEWRLTSLTPLTQAKQYALNASKRYAERPIGELLMKPQYQEKGNNGDHIYQIRTGNTLAQYMDTHHLMTKAGWRVHILSPMRPLLESMPAIMLLSA